jgi:arylsulfatase A-like enzyme
MVFLAALAGLLSLVQAGCDASGGEKHGDRAPSNIEGVVVVTLDTTRVDHLGYHGYIRDTSPRLDALSEQSVVFERAIAPMATTLPSHVSLFTATYPEEHGVLANVKHGGLKFVPSPELTPAAEIARRRDWATAAFVSSAPVKRGTGIAAGFETFDQPSGYARPAEKTIEPALDWLRQLDDERFFLWVHLFDPHNPYRPPPEYRDLFERDAAFESFLEERGIPPTVVHKGRERDVLRVTDLYDGEIRYMDAQLGRLFDLLRHRGLREHVVLIVAGDHGEGLGQHGELAHGCIHGSQLHVPMMFRAPGLEPRRIRKTASLVDLLPTVFGTTLPALASRLDQQASGRNVLAGESSPVVSQRTARKRKDIHPFAYTLTTDRYKLVWEPTQGGDTRLYDLRQDPHELRDIAPAAPGTVSTLRDRLTAEIGHQKRRGEALRPDGVRREPVDPERLEQLRSLGYVD